MTSKTTLHLSLSLPALKENEDYFLAALVGFFAQRQDTYLADLFTEAFHDYVTQQIRADFPPDVFQYLSDAQKELQEKGRENLEQATRAATAETRVENLRLSIQRMETEHVARLDELAEDKAALRRGKYDAECTALEQKVRADKLQAENDRLKIMLFDLEHPAEES